MSLISWYPLTEDFIDKGPAGENLTYQGSATVTFTSGKLGNASTFTNNAATLQRPLLTKNDNFSACCWFCITAATSTRQHIFSNGRDVLNDGWGIDVNTSLKLRWACGSYIVNHDDQLTAGKWYHAAIVCDNGVAHCYLNGVEVHTGTVTTLPLFVQGGNYCNLGRTANGTNYSYPLNGQINDFRYYDHPLSVKEVKELAKGEVLHYALKGTGTNPNLTTKSQTINDSSGNPSNFTHETKIYNGETVRRMTCKTDGYTGGPFGTGFLASQWEAGKTYTWSMMVRGSSNFTLTSVGHESGGGRRSIDVTTEWQYYTHTWTATASSYTAWTFYGRTWALNDWIEVKHLKVEEGSIATPYIPHVDETVYSVISANSSIEYDLTGYGHNATKTSIGQVSDSPRNITAIDFTAKTSHITTTAVLPSATELTCSIWAKFDEDTLTTSSNSTSSLFAFDGSVFLRCRLQNSGTDFWVYWNKGSHFTYVNSTSLIDNKWHHFVITFNAGIVKLYIDGTIKHTATTTLASLTSSNTQWILGEYSNNSETFDGQLSDFRIYATALTDNDIKELYNTSASIDNTYKMHTIELNSCGNSSITPNYGTRSVDFYETNGTSTYTVAGTPTENNGVFSGFSSANYITTNGSISADSDKFIIYGHYRTGNTIGSDEYVACSSSRNITLKLLTNKFCLSVSNNNGSSWTNYTNGPTNVTTNTDYFYKIVSDNTNFYVYINGDLIITTPIPTGTFASATWGFGNHLPTKADSTKALGAIDIKQCGIIINGENTWRGIDAYLGSNKAKIGTNYMASYQFKEV